MNKNQMIIGTTGSGKSCYLKNEIENDKESRIFLIDPLGDYKTITHENKGTCLLFSHSSGVVINPLEIRSQKENALHLKVSRLKRFFRTIKHDLSPLETALIEVAILETYRQKNICMDTDFSKLKEMDFPTLEDFYQIAQSENRLSDFSAILKSYVSGINSQIFNGVTNVDLSQRFNCFDMRGIEEVEPDTRDAVWFNCLSFIADELTKEDGLEKRLVIDEMIHMGAGSEKLLENMLKRIRKSNASFMGCIQEVHPALRGMLENCDSKLILRSHPTGIEALNLSEEEKKMVRNLTRGEGLLIEGENRKRIALQYV